MKTADGLTPQQERFAQEVANGKSQAEACRIAYPRSAAWKPGALWSKASTLMATEKVSRRVASLREELEKRALWTREDSVRTLMSVIQNPEKPTDVVSAVKELNAMHGYNAPVELTVNTNVRSIRLVPLRADESKG